MHEQVYFLWETYKKCVNNNNQEDIMDIESQDANLRKLKTIQIIQSTCQFLTVVRSSLTSQTLDHLTTLSNYVNNLNSIKINGEDFLQSFIQVAYLIFTCKFLGKNITINEEDVKVEESIESGYEKRFSVIIFYRLHQDNVKCYSAIVHELFEYLFGFFFKCCEAEAQQKHIIGHQIKQTLSTFKKQYDFIALNLHPTEPNNQRQYFNALEQTSLFRENSTLLQIKNNSILDVIKMHLMASFKELKKRDLENVKNYHKEKTKIKAKAEEIKKVEKKIEQNILDFFAIVEKNGPQKTKVSLDEDQNGKVKFTYEIQEAGGQSFVERIKGVSQVFKDIMVEEFSNESRHERNCMKFHIEYSSERNSICVRLIYDINNINNESADLLMYQSNALTFDTANVSIEVLDSKFSDLSKNQQQSMSQKKDKFLAFKAASCLNDKQAPLQKILILMDLTMISSKIYQPYLNFQKVPENINSHKLSIIHNKVNHYTKLYLRCARKIYNQ